MIFFLVGGHTLIELIVILQDLAAAASRHAANIPIREAPVLLQCQSSVHSRWLLSL